jgi:biotin carboxyl carrier protein
VKRFEILLNEKVYLVEVTRISGDSALVIVNGTEYEVGINDLSRGAIPKMKVVGDVPLQATPAAVTKPKPKVAVETVGGATTVRAPLPGLIIDVKVNVGDKVKIGDVLLVIETMKMENNIVSPRLGTIKEIKVAKGASVNEGAPLIVIGD